MYDTKESIASSLASYPSFLEMLRVRNEQGYIHKQRMNEWIVFGRVRLDTCGNAMLIIEPKDPSWAKETVYSSDEAFRAMAAAGFEDRMSSTTGHKPGVGILCPLCGKGWGLDNFWDNRCEQNSVNVDLTPYIGRTLQQIEDMYKLRTDGRWFLGTERPMRNDKYIDLSIPDPKWPEHKANGRGYLFKKTLNYKGEEIGDIDYSHVIESGDEACFVKLTYTHEACYMAKLTRETHAEFTDAFQKAGVKIITMREIPNEYGSVRYNGPWYQMSTDFGELKVGWRKRVIEIDYSKIKLPVGLKLSTLFVGEQTTVDEIVVHCWGYDKLVDYLGRIKDALGVAA